jgi:acyl-CoA synthetase (AMP-forming)/AMP-acid ligase II
LSHASGAYVLPFWVSGAKNVIMEHFDIDDFFKTIQDEKITTLQLVPTMVVRLLNHPSLKKYDLSSLRSITYGAAPMAEDKIKEAIKVFGPVLSQGYGQVEAPMTICLLKREDHVSDGSPEQAKRLLSVGKPYPDVEVKIVDDDDNEMPTGEVGEIIVRSDHQMKGYWRNEEQTKIALKNGWVHTRDMGYMDELGYVYLVDRKGDMIISGGFNIFPREIEELLNNHPSVLEVAVVGVPDEEWGEAVKAMVALKTGKEATEKELIEYCKKTLTGYKRPKTIDFLPELPRNTTGKIDKKTIKAKYWAGRARNII